MAIQNGPSPTAANLAEIAWQTQHPWPAKLICDHRSEFMATVMKIQNVDSGIQPSGIAAQNPQVNSALERARQRTGNMIRSFEVLHSHDRDKKLILGQVF
jgi:hypothetical protein